DYLIKNPEFFIRNVRAVEAIRVPHPVRGTVSLVEWHMARPDNLRSAVKKAERYEPVINDSYQALAEHYGTVIFPARPRKPKDKPKAENG
ncbi:DUF484 family protein, partial [Escherichia coli]